MWLRKPVLVLPPSSCIYNNHVKKSFLEYFKHIFNSCVDYQVLNCKPGWRPPSQPHTFSDRLLFDETFAQPDVFAVVNCSVAASGVVLLHCCNAPSLIFVFVNCADV